MGYREVRTPLNRTPLLQDDDCCGRSHTHRHYSANMTRSSGRFHRDTTIRINGGWGKPREITWTMDGLSCEPEAHVSQPFAIIALYSKSLRILKIWHNLHNTFFYEHSYRFGGIHCITTLYGWVFNTGYNCPSMECVSSTMSVWASVAAGGVGVCGGGGGEIRPPHTTFVD